MQFVFIRVIQLIERYGGSEVQNKQKTKNKNPWPSRSALKHTTQVSNSSCIFVCSRHGCRFLCLFFSLVFLHHVYILILFLLFFARNWGRTCECTCSTNKSKTKKTNKTGVIFGLPDLEFVQIRHRAHTLSTSLIVDWDWGVQGGKSVTVQTEDGIHYSTSCKMSFSYSDRIFLLSAWHPKNRPVEIIWKLVILTQKVDIWQPVVTYLFSSICCIFLCESHPLELFR